MWIKACLSGVWETIGFKNIFFYLLKLFLILPYQNNIYIYIFGKHKRVLSSCWKLIPPVLDHDHGPDAVAVAVAVAVGQDAKR